MGDWTGYQIGLAFMMLITGSINTLSTKWADTTKAVGINKDETPRTFDHPFLQATGMFLGELSCLFVFFCVRCHQRRSGPLMEGSEPRQHKFNWFIFLPAALCDMVGTSTMYIGLNLTNASSFQMLRGAVVLFTALLSVAFLGRSIKCHMWTGMTFILLGLALVGISDIVFSSSDEFQDKNAVIAGDLLIILAQIVTAAQMVYEEKVVSKYNVAPLKAVGLEGLFGFTILGLLLIPMYFIIAGKPFTNDPDFRLENAIDAFYQMKNNWRILLATLGNITSIAFFNFSGISVTKEISATTRMVLDSCRTIIIWAVSLGVGWQTFAWNSFLCQLGGFALLFTGMCLYNDIIFAPLLRRVGCLKSEEEGEDMRPILDRDGEDDGDDDDDLLYTPPRVSGPVTARENDRYGDAPSVVYS